MDWGWGQGGWVGCRGWGGRGGVGGGGGRGAVVWTGSRWGGGWGGGGGGGGVCWGCCGGWVGGDWFLGLAGGGEGGGGGEGDQREGLGVHGRGGVSCPLFVVRCYLSQKLSRSRFRASRL